METLNVFEKQCSVWGGESFSEPNLLAGGAAS